MVLKPRDGLLDEFVLVARDRLHADRVEIVDRRAEPGRVGDVAGPGFEPIRRALIDRLLEGDVGDHDAAALPGRYGLENRLLAVNRADACRREHLMARQQRGVMPPHGAWVLLALASCRAALRLAFSVRRRLHIQASLDMSFPRDILPSLIASRSLDDAAPSFRQKTSLPPTSASVPAIRGRSTRSGTREAKWLPIAMPGIEPDNSETSSNQSTEPIHQ
jgi:hypothetical protein